MLQRSVASVSSGAKLAVTLEVIAPHSSQFKIMLGISLVTPLSQSLSNIRLEPSDFVSWSTRYLWGCACKESLACGREENGVFQVGLLKSSQEGRTLQ